MQFVMFIYWIVIIIFLCDWKLHDDAIFYESTEQTEAFSDTHNFFH
jgi:hypothetical protein